MTRRRAVFSLSFVLAVGLIACKAPVVEPGKLVKVEYTLTVDGSVVDTSTGKGPLSYVQGNKQIIPGLEDALAGLKVGDKKKVTIPPEKGYGPINPQAKQKVPLSMFGDKSKLKIGMMVSGQNGGRPVQARVLEIGKKDVTLDFNHPLAGKTLEFDVTVVGIEKAPAPDLPEPQPVPPSKQ